LDDRGVEKRILSLCRERGVAVICNRSFGGGGLLARLKDKPLPGWAAQVQVNSWAQLTLKFLQAHSAVTCVIPGTGNPRYMVENAGAGFGPMLTDAAPAVDRPGGVVAFARCFFSVRTRFSHQALKNGYLKRTGCVLHYEENVLSGESVPAMPLYPCLHRGESLRTQFAHLWRNFLPVSL
jgi:hypothetical protein